MKLGQFAGRQLRFPFAGSLGDDRFTLQGQIGCHADQGRALASAGQGVQHGGIAIWGFDQQLGLLFQA